MVIEDVLHRPLLDLRISVTDRCNMRCRYCMPREHFDEDHEFLPKEDILRFEEIARVVQALIPHGLRKVRLTGGEPLLRRDLHELVRQLRECSSDLDIAITSNGLLLKKQLKKLHDAGLSRVTISLDALDENIYQSMGDTDASPSIVLEAIDAVEKIGLPIKVNTVVKKDVNDNQILAMVNEFGPRKIPVRFIEYMDVGSTNDWNLDHVVSAKAMRSLLEQELGPLESNKPLHTSDVAKVYTTPDGWKVGFIESITNPFCGNCSRARLSANGSVYTCLFANHGHDVRGILRMDGSPEDITRAIQSIWIKRSDRYSEERTNQTTKIKVEMSYIGG
ncbi:MAG: GTP 3',8-cyclase [Euryarchaeota archaeon UBA443]|nr:GTP 3',8-cyclase MoaA [Euryarchaeota archaeon]CAI8270604.1 MAG: GTP 3',8-cyclase [Euryarchaeota archaeon UBA443]